MLWQKYIVSFIRANFGKDVCLLKCNLRKMKGIARIIIALAVPMAAALAKSNAETAMAVASALSASNKSHC